MGEIQREDLDAWEIDDLRPDFEDRVMAALDRQPAVTQGRWPIWLAIAAVVIVAGALGVMLMSGKWKLVQRHEEGSVVVAIAGGAKAFPEEGARIDVDGATVRQSAGKVIYEVPSGVELVVATAAGDVTVLGTRFEVEVMEMNAATKRTLMGAGALAMGTIAVAVLVHEGNVTLANDHGQVKVAATQQAYATDTTAPVKAGEKKEPAVAATNERAKQRARRDEMLGRIQDALQARTVAASEMSREESSEQPPSEPSLDKDYIREVVQEQVVELLQECYENALQKNPALGGKIVLHFNITGDESVGGVIEDLTVTEASTLRDAEMNECVAESMASATFDPPKGGGTVEITYPFVFEVSDE